MVKPEARKGPSIEPASYRRSCDSTRWIVGECCRSWTQVMQKELRDLNDLRRFARDGKGVADDGLLAFIDAEGEAADTSSVEGDEAGQDAGIEVLEEELGGALVVPTQSLLPEA